MKGIEEIISVNRQAAAPRVEKGLRFVYLAIALRGMPTGTYFERICLTI